MSKRITLFCASSPAVNKAYFDDATAIAKLMVEKKMHLVYGGGAIGLMGCIADIFIKAKARITGVIPHFMVNLEWQHPQVDDMVIVDAMAQRKELLVKDSDGVLVLPGSLGTFEEVIEVLSMKKLGLYFKPVVFLNTKGYFNPLIEMLESAASENFMRKEHTLMYNVADSPEKALSYLLNSSNSNRNARDFAQVV